jgi:acetylornithine deacetylase/succinyl-diaminopimelate desuccinylase-like protein
MKITRQEFLKTSAGAAAGAALARPSFFDFLDRGFAVEAAVEEERLQKIYNYIEQHKSEHIRKIQAFLRQPSVSSWNMGVVECAEMLRGYFKELGCKEAELVKTDGYPGVWGWYDGGARKTISHYMMYDTQPFVKERWSSPPLEANLVRMGQFPSVVMARGAINSKGPIRAFLNACEAIIAVEGKLPVNIMFTAEGEEEQGSPHFHQVLEPYIDKLKRCQAHLGAGPSQNSLGEISMSLGVKGIAYVELEAHGQTWGRGPQKMPIHSSRKAVLDSPVWRLVKAISSMVDEAGNRILIDGYYDAIKKPSEEQVALVETIIQKFGDRAFASERENVRAFANNWTPAEAIRHLVFDTTLNIDGFGAGYTGPGVATILPEKAIVKMDSRLVNAQKSTDQIKLMRAHLNKHGFSDIKLTQLGGGDEWCYTSVRQPVVQSVLSVYKKYGIEPMIWPWSAGSSPQSQYTNPPLNLPACSGGLGHGGRAHSDDEYFVIEGNGKVGGLVECEKSIVDVLFAFANWPEV